MPSQTLIKNAQIVFPDKVKKSDLLISGNLITEIAEEIIPNSNFQIIDGTNKYLLPGFIDIHTHGAKGFDFSLGEYEAETNLFANREEVYKQGLSKALSYFLKTGTTTILPTTLAAPLKDLSFSFAQIKAFCESENSLSRMIAGINLEGTFIKNPAYAGAQNSAYFFSPNSTTFDQLHHASGNRIKILNLPPEHEEFGTELSNHLIRENVKIAGGHSGANAEQFRRAVKEGLSLGVHFLNGPSRSSSKPFNDGGAVEEMLRNDDISLEIIADGFHVHPAYIRDTIARKGFEKIIVITDSLFVNGLQNLNAFEISGISGEVSDNGQYLQVRGKADTLFGSVLTMDKAFENMINWLTKMMTGIWYRKHSAFSLENAILKTSQMLSGNPAKFIGMDDSVGSIANRKQANLILANISQSKTGFQFQIEDVFLNGSLIAMG